MRNHSHWPVTCFLFLILTSGNYTSASWNSSSPTVRLESGVLEGMRFSSMQSEVAFLGVPYAAPPVGDLRWKPPQPVSPWTSTRKATEFGAACPQLPAKWFPYIGWNEDCLYLNVWTTQFSASAKLPVIVYFHGGSRTVGDPEKGSSNPSTLLHSSPVSTQSKLSCCFCRTLEGELSFFATVTAGHTNKSPAC
jgi:hypothetical protein